MTKRENMDTLPLSQPGLQIDHFKVLRMLGRGGMGEVHLARDTKLGRKVAIKLIRPDRLRSEGAVEGFLFEARATAKLSHPNIVTIHAVGEHEGCPYVALEYLEGQDLGERLQERTFSAQETIRMALPIAEALTEAHRRGILHRDLKPANIVIPRDGRLRIVDFGIAQVLGQPELALDETAPASNRASLIAMQPSGGGTPGYMAPEQWKEQVCSAAVDVWALGVIIFQMCAGRRPFLADNVADLVFEVCRTVPAPALADHAEVPADLDALVSSCLSKDPKARPRASEVAGALRAMLPGATRELADEESPFRGLLPFGEQHTSMFFGRDSEIAAFIERARLHPVLPVVGPSGAGKSSFVQAGVIPRLREQERWLVLALRPGSRPLRSLARRILHPESQSQRSHAPVPKRQTDDMPTMVSPGDTEALADDAKQPAAAAMDDDESFDEALTTDPNDPARTLAIQLLVTPNKLGVLLNELAERHGSKVLLFVDQLEELFTMTEDPSERVAFMEAIASAADDGIDPVRVVFTVRDDYLGRLATSDKVQSALTQVTVIQSLATELLSETLQKPLEACGYRFEDAKLIETMVQQVRGERAGLPLLQFAALQLWEQRDKNKRYLTRRAYEQMGGVAGALARHADGVLDGLTPVELALARELVLQLVTTEHTRRIVSKRDALEGMLADADRVLRRLTDARLITIVKTRGVGASSMLELAHESLIESWGTLARWLDESREERVFLADALQAAKLWDRRGRRRTELWEDRALREALKTLQRCRSVPQIVAEFLKASERAERKRTQQRRRRRFAVVAISLSVAAIALLVTAVIADKEREAREQRNEAQLRRAESLLESAWAALGDDYPLEARSKVRGALEIADSASARALWWRLRTTTLWSRSHRLGMNYQLAYAPDSTTIASARSDKTVGLYDTTTGSWRLLRGHVDQVFSVALSADGKQLASGSWGGLIRLWSTQTGKSTGVLRGHRDGVRALAFAPDGLTLASASEDQTVRLWTLQQHKERSRLKGHAKAVRTVVFSPDGRTVASAGDDKTVLLWTSRNSKLLATLKGHTDSVASLAFSPDGKSLASSSRDGSTRLWDMATHKQRYALLQPGNELRAARFSPDGKRIATASRGGVIRLWSVESRRPLRDLAEGAGGLNDIRFSPDGLRLAVAAVDRTLRVLDLQNTGPRLHATPHPEPVYGLAFSPDDETIATTSRSGDVGLWTTRSGKLNAILSTEASALWAVDFSPDGKQMAVGGSDGLVRLWRRGQLDSYHKIRAHRGTVSALRYSPDGAFIASGGADGVVVLWNAATNQQHASFEGQGGQIYSVVFSPNGEMLASNSSNGSVRIWGVGSGRLLRELAGHQGASFGLAFHPEGRWLASSGGDKMLRLWDPGSGVMRHEHNLPARTYWLDIHPRGDLVALPGADGVVRLYQPSRRKQRNMLGHTFEVNNARFSHDGKVVASVGDDGTLRLWDVASASSRWSAPLMLQSPFRLLRATDGVISMDDGKPSKWPWGPKLRKALLAQGSRAQSDGGDLVCMHTHAGGAEVWSAAKDARISSAALADVEQVIALTGRCVVRSPKGVSLIDASGKLTALPLTGPPTAIAADEQTVFVATAGKALFFDSTGKLLRSQTTSSQVSALSMLPAKSNLKPEDRLVVGFPDGDVSWRAQDGSGLVLHSRAPPLGSVIKLMAGPRDTILVGFSTGLIQLLDARDGALLNMVRMHGKLAHMARSSHTLYAATDLGTFIAWDLSDFELDYCALLRNVWKRVPIQWRRRRAYVAPPPKDHPCNSPPS